MLEGKIIKLVSNDYTVISDKLYVCKCRGKFRNEKIQPLVGDDVVFDPKNNYILEIKKRKNELVRPPISNIDQAYIVTNVKPTFNSNLLDKLLCIIEFNNIKPIIIFTKIDLLNEEELNEIKKSMQNKISVLSGQSGARKSTLLNRIDSNLDLKTDEISVALGRGKHTTRHVELLKIGDGLVADTPGFSSLDFNVMENTDIRDNFIEFNEYKEKCEYRDCMHLNEEKCGIKNNPDILDSRYENYVSFIKINKKNRW